MSASLRARLAKLEALVPLKGTERMSDAEMCDELNRLLEHARCAVWWSANHPQGMTGPYVHAFTLEEVTLEMIVESEHVEEGWRFVAQTLIDVNHRRQQDKE